MVGATPLLISVLLKCTPLRWLKRLEGGPCGIVDETKAMDNKLTQGFDKLAAMEVGGADEAAATDDNFGKMDGVGGTKA